MYRLNELGDCFLTTFTSGTSTSRLLIDCGSFRNANQSITRIKQIVASIAADTAGAPLDVVVGTHQHNDHLSGFVHCEAEFRQIGINEVWLSWLDDPSDPMARRFGDQHDNLVSQLAAARDQLAHSPIRTQGVRPYEILSDILGFYGSSAVGAAPAVPAHGIKILKTIGKNAPLYLRPGQTLEMPGLPSATVRVHVLGPPRSDLLKRTDPRAGESYDASLAAANVQATKFLDAINLRAGTVSREEQQYPFAEQTKKHADHPSQALRTMMRRYRNKGDSWRKIDTDWLNPAGSLALYLDSLTNNSSLALAIELIDSGKVLLFAADAQIGNWLSWQDITWRDPTINTDDLVARTVFYKVGHHASHNATLVGAFEKMNRPDLIALIPVNKQDPNITKQNGWKMPATNLFKRLNEKTQHRVLQMDGDNPRDCDPARNPAKDSWRSISVKPTITPLEIKVTITG
jgi:hypothetical protein